VVIKMTADEIYKKLRAMSPPQLVDLVHQLHLRDEYLSNVLNVAATIVADEICKQARLIYGDEWESRVSQAVIDVVTGARNYWQEKLGHIKDFLVEPPEELEGAQQRRRTVKELKDALAEREKLEEPQLVKVSGTLFPAALLASGWWERTHAEGIDIKWRSTLQKWLFEGFDLWAPSWDVSWDLEGREPTPKLYYIAQLAQGDEAESIRIVLGPKRAKEWREKFLKGWKKNMWCGYEVEVTGVLGHKHQAKKALLGIEVLDPFNPKDANEYCVWLKDDEPKHDIVEVGDTDLYSGYLWKCMIPRKWIEEKETIGLGDVYIVWEHTNFAASDALTYNLEALGDKEAFIQKKHKKDGGLVLLQKSHQLIVPGDNPMWSVGDFYRMLLSREKIKVSEALLAEARARPQAKERK
jgi:hypothetical protein